MEFANKTQVDYFSAKLSKPVFHEVAFDNLL